MKKLSRIGGLLKKLYRNYSMELLEGLGERGFNDLRPSFLEVLLQICESDGPSIKLVGDLCGLKKQTMTSHLNELEKRGYILRKTNQEDRREQNLYLTDYGEKFKLALFETIDFLEKKYVETCGAVELERIEHQLNKFFENTRNMNDELGFDL